MCLLNGTQNYLSTTTSSDSRAVTFVSPWIRKENDDLDPTNTGSEGKMCTEQNTYSKEGLSRYGLSSPGSPRQEQMESFSGSGLCCVHTVVIAEPCFRRQLIMSVAFPLVVTVNLKNSRHVSAQHIWRFSNTFKMMQWIV